MVDHFAVFSGDNYFTHDYDRRKDVLSLGNPSQVGKKKGTAVIMSIRKNSSIEAKKLFDDFSSDDGEFSFQKTIVPIKLVKYATKDMLVSRSQAKMVLSGLEDFSEILFDFKGVMMIGQGFADEIFRVYKKNNPNKKLGFTNANRKIVPFIKKAVLDSQK
ncbi:ATP-binding region, ATPase-like [hydrothermal vent metagenome]|uniref:ATP-binding region, ATPase-like n=1 Tax=hydrothermal vent metagenome TaxID=652676 RepID=A0A3B0WAH8_9ZZZZ